MRNKNVIETKILYNIIRVIRDSSENLRFNDVRN